MLWARIRNACVEVAPANTDRYIATDITGDTAFALQRKWGNSSSKDVNEVQATLRAAYNRAMQEAKS